MNSTVCFKSWTRRLRGVAGGLFRSCVSLITADIEQVFEACSSSFRLGSPISVIWSRVVFVFNSCPGLGVIQVHVGIVGNVGGIPIGDQRQKHRQLGFLSRSGYPAAASRGEGMWMMLWLAAAYFVVAAFLFLHAPVTRYQSRLVSGAVTAFHTWVDVELRVVGQHVAVNIKNPNRSWVHNRRGVLKGGLGFHSGCSTGSFGQNQDAGTRGTFWGGSSPRGHGGVGVFGISSVRHSGPGPLFALQPCCPDLSQNCANVVVFFEGTNGR